MRFAAIATHDSRFRVAWMCRRLRVSTSGYYAWKRRMPSRRAQEDARLRVRIRLIHRQSGGTYGSRRVKMELQATTPEFAIGRGRIQKLMRMERVAGVPKRRFKVTTNSKHTLRVAPNFVERNFEADAPNRVWVADITYVRTWEGWLYLAIVLDLFSRRVVGYAMADHMRADLVTTAFQRAVAARQPAPGLIHHSDRGSQYASAAFQRALEAVGAVCSMSRKADCFDNAVAESFFGTIKQELIYRTTLSTRRHARRRIVDYMDFYETRRRHSALGYVSPLEYEISLMQRRRAA